MNFLAHQFLSFDDPALKTGNLLGEFVKGKDYQQYIPALQKGILLHRKIDDFTDRHPLVCELSKSMHTIFHKYSPVIVDIYFDYCLAINWWRFSDQNLNNFAQNTYAELQSFAPILPARIQTVINRMREHDWLSHYQTMEGIQMSFNNLIHRARFDNNIKEAISYLYVHQKNIEAIFLEFFPEIIVECKRYLKGLEK